MDTSFNSPRRHAVKITYGKRKQEPEIKKTTSSFPFSSLSLATTTPPTNNLRLFRTEQSKKVGPRSKKNRFTSEETKNVEEKDTSTTNPSKKTPGKRGRKRPVESIPNSYTATNPLKNTDFSNQSTPRKRGRPRKKKSPRNPDSEVEFLGENVEYSSVRKSNRIKSTDKRVFQTDLPLHPAVDSLIVSCVEIPPKTSILLQSSDKEVLEKNPQSSNEEKVQDLVKENLPSNQEMENEHQSESSPADEQVKQSLVLSLAEKALSPTTCEECGLSFNFEDRADDASHETFHKAILHGIDYPGYKHDQIVEFFADQGDSIIVISKQSGSRERRKAKEIVHYINTYLGSTNLDESRLDECKIYIYVRAKKVVGCVVAEPIEKAYRLSLTSAKQTGESSSNATEDKPQESPATDIKVSVVKADMCDSLADQPLTTHLDHTPISVICGIHRMWVCTTQRRQGIASRLLDAVCKNFLYGCPLKRHELAFSQPTPSGKGFAQSYTNTLEYLIYVEKA